MSSIEDSQAKDFQILPPPEVLEALQAWREEALQHYQEVLSYGTLEDIYQELLSILGTLVPVLTEEEHHEKVRDDINLFQAVDSIHELQPFLGAVSDSINHPEFDIKAVHKASEAIFNRTSQPISIPLLVGGEFFVQILTNDLLAISLRTTHEKTKAAFHYTQKEIFNQNNKNNFICIQLSPLNFATKLVHQIQLSIQRKLTKHPA